jgi:hypothetical protein
VTSPSSSGIAVEVRDGIVFVTHHGVIDARDNDETLGHILRTAFEAQSTRLLFDFTDATMPNYHTISVEYGNQAVAIGLARFRIALVGRSGDPMLTFMETVAINRGVSARSFAIREAAIEWLNS